MCHGKVEYQGVRRREEVILSLKFFQGYSFPRRREEVTLSLRFFQDYSLWMCVYYNGKNER
jgi:hypothetical protein